MSMSRYIEALINDGNSKYLEKLVNIFRFQDDLFAVNDDGLFESILTDVYPVEMKVSKTNISTFKCSYLDLLISVYKGNLE